MLNNTESIINGLFPKKICDYKKCQNLQEFRDFKCRNDDSKNSELCKKINTEIALCSKQWIECRKTKYSSYF
jgi:hypothetical protein